LKFQRLPCTDGWLSTRRNLRVSIGAFVLLECATGIVRDPVFVCTMAVCPHSEGMNGLPVRRSVDDLLMVVDELARPRPGRKSECPWTSEQTCAAIMPWMRSEVSEVLEALVWYDMAAPEEKERAAKHLTSELGDLLFDVLLAARLAERDIPGVSIEAASAAAALKIKGRTPYMPRWKRVEGEVHSEDEAIKLWKAAKMMEPEHRDPWRPAALDRLAKRRGLILNGVAIVIGVSAGLAMIKR